MKYSIKVNEVRAKEGSNNKGFATVVFGDSFKITNIAILENKDKGELFVSMPRYRSNERDESNGVIYKDVCNPITAEFREELYTNILDAYARIKEPEKEETQKQDRTQEMPEFSVTVTPYEREVHKNPPPKARRYRITEDRKSTRLNSSHSRKSRMPSSA